jgi:hypothetical protein
MQAMTFMVAPQVWQIDYQLQYSFSPKKNPTLGAFAYYANDYLHQKTLTDHGVGARVMGRF